MSSKNLFIELNVLSLLAVFYYYSRHCFECAKFKTISVFIHLIRGSKIEVIFLHFKYKSFQKYYDVFFVNLDKLYLCVFTIKQTSYLICLIV